MADRVPVSIVLGGSISAAGYSILASIIVHEDLSAEWDGPPFEEDHRTVGEPLALYAHEVAWGTLKELERYCREHELPFVLWSGGYPGQWNPARLVFRGVGVPDSYIVDENDRVLIDRRTITKLGAVKAVLDYFEAADFAVPPLIVEGDPPVAPVSLAPLSIPGEKGHG